MSVVTASSKQSWRDVYPPHDAAAAFPMVGGVPFEQLVEDVRANGIRQPVVVWTDSEGKTWTLDGRKRFRAAEAAGIELDDIPIIWTSPTELNGHRIEDPVGYVVSTNLRRRHLSAKQQRDVIRKLDPQRSSPEPVATAAAQAYEILEAVRALPRFDPMLPDTAPVPVTLLACIPELGAYTRYLKGRIDAMRAARGLVGPAQLDDGTLL